MPNHGGKAPSSMSELAIVGKVFEENRLRLLAMVDGGLTLR